MTHDDHPGFSHIEPILSVSNITETIQHWQDVLGFTGKWMMGDPPFHGGVSWQNIRVMFSQLPNKDEKPSINVLWIRVKYLDRLYALHQKHNANIAEPLERKPWGLDEYVVRDNNGHYIAFSGHSSVREKSGVLPQEVTIIERLPTIEEMLALADSVGWRESFQPVTMDKRLAAAVFAVVAVDTRSNKTIGCALLLGDHSSFYYVKDVMVHKDWQKKRVGTALMRSVTTWLDKNGIPKSLVGLYTGEDLEPFYQQFGFEKAFGMVKRIQ